jgi:hypothetical protein
VGTLKQVSIRRGPQQVKFTSKEVREMMNLEEASMWAIPEHIMEGVEKRGLSRQQERVINSLRDGSKSPLCSKSGKSFNIEFGGLRRDIRHCRVRRRMQKWC